MSVNEAKYRAAEQRYWALEGVVPSEVWLDLPHTGTRVRVQVVGDGPPVVFVHGVNNGGTSWGPLAARMPGFRCLLLDRPGCGLSEPLTTRFDDVRAFVPFAESLIVDVLDALALDRAHLIATSLGGYHALRTAAAHPERLRRVVEFSFPIGAPVGDTPWLMRLAGVRGLAKVMARVPVNDRMVRSMLAQAGLREAIEGGRVSSEAIAWFRALINHTDTFRNDIDAAPPILHPLRGMNDSLLLSDGVLGRIQAPMLFLWGSEDPFGGEAVAREFVPKIAGAELQLMPGAGHAPWMDDPAGAAVATAEFLGRASS